MAEGRVGWYIHHHGNGHLSRAKAVSPFVSKELVFFSSHPEVGSLSTFGEIVQLPPDTKPDYRQAEEVPDCFHYAPTDLPEIGLRMQTLANALIESKIAVLVVDVSVEITLFARLMGIPTIVVRQNGKRQDLAHQMAYQAAEKLIAPFPKILDVRADLVAQKTIYTGGFSRYESAKGDFGKPKGYYPNKKNVLILTGLGGSTQHLDPIIQLAVHLTGYQFHIVGSFREQGKLPENIVFHGLVTSTQAYIFHADLVIGSCGHNTVMEVAQLGKPYVAIPEERPFDEQTEKAKALESLKLAVVLPKMPDPEELKQLMKKIRHLDLNGWQSIVDDQAPKRFGSILNDFNRVVYLASQKKTA